MITAKIVMHYEKERRRKLLCVTPFLNMLEEFLNEKCIVCQTNKSIL
jgi:hypothetical protein